MLLPCVAKLHVVFISFRLWTVESEQELQENMFFIGILLKDNLENMCIYQCLLMGSLCSPFLPEMAMKRNVRQLNTDNGKNIRKVTEWWNLKSTQVTGGNISFDVKW